jgi:hypothetical protein
MTAYVGWNSGTYSEEDYTQAQLRERWEVTYADTVFLSMIGVSLLPYVGSIIEVTASEGVYLRNLRSTKKRRALSRLTRTCG